MQFPNTTQLFLEALEALASALPHPALHLNCTALKPLRQQLLQRLWGRVVMSTGQHPRKELQDEDNRERYSKWRRPGCWKEPHPFQQAAPFLRNLGSSWLCGPRAGKMRWEREIRNQRPRGTWDSLPGGLPRYSHFMGRKWRLENGTVEI